jgi:hypothetical protein
MSTDITRQVSIKQPFPKVYRQPYKLDCNNAIIYNLSELFKDTTELYNYTMLGHQ